MAWLRHQLNLFPIVPYPGRMSSVDLLPSLPECPFPCWSEKTRIFSDVSVVFQFAIVASHNTFQDCWNQYISIAVVGFFQSSRLLCFVLEWRIFRHITKAAQLSRGIDHCHLVWIWMPCFHFWSNRRLKQPIRQSIQMCFQWTVDCLFRYGHRQWSIQRAERLSVYQFDRRMVQGMQAFVDRLIL
jgi:hypothetical protein